MRNRIRLLGSLLAVALGGAAGWMGFQWYARLPVHEARWALEAERWPAAVQWAEGWLAQHPADQEAMLLAARAYARQGRWEEAEAYFAQVPLEELDDFHLRGEGLVTRKLYDEAAIVFEQVLQRWPMDGEALQRLAALRGEQLRMQEALILARRLCQVPTHQVSGHVLTGMLETQYGNPDRAIEALETALRLSPNLEGSPVKVETVWIQLAEMLFYFGRPAEAEPYARQARERMTGPKPCWILGRVCEQRGDEQGARQYWEEAVARDPSFVPALRELGRLALLQQQPNEALTWLVRAYDAEPQDLATVQALAAAYRQLGQEEAALRVLKDSEAARQ